MTFFLIFFPPTPLIWEKKSYPISCTTFFVWYSFSRKLTHTKSPKSQTITHTSIVKARKTHTTTPTNLCIPHPSLPDVGSARLVLCSLQLFSSPLCSCNVPIDPIEHNPTQSNSHDFQLCFHSIHFHRKFKKTTSSRRILTTLSGNGFQLVTLKIKRSKEWASKSKKIRMSGCLGLGFQHSLFFLQLFPRIRSWVLGRLCVLGCGVDFEIYGCEVMELQDKCR